MAQQKFGSGRRLVVRTTRLAIVSGAGAFSPAALAHGNMNAGAFYQGMATVFMHWDLLLFFVAAALYAAQQSLRLRPWIGAVLVLGIGAGFLISLGGIEIARPAVVSAAAFVLVGLLVAARLTRPARRCASSWRPAPRWAAGWRWAHWNLPAFNARSCSSPV